MRGEQYFLVLVGCNDTIYRVYRKPMTLRQIDERTTKYKNKGELVKKILENTNVYLDPNEIAEVRILRQPNSKKNHYRKERGPIYKKDIEVLNEEGIRAKLEIMLMDKEFILAFIKRYGNVKNFWSLCSGIKSSICTGEDYSELLEELCQKVLSTYKGHRNTYFLINDYENKKRRKKIVNYTNKKDSSKDSIEYDKELTEEEFEEVRLNYLMEHERELLDIDDFSHNEELSCFDAHKSR